MPITPRCQSSPPPLGLRPFVDLGESFVEDPLFHRLPVAIETLEVACEAPRLFRVLGEQELESGSRMPETTGRVDSRR
jgi:hypothetical protein